MSRMLDGGSTKSGGAGFAGAGAGISAIPSTLTIMRYAFRAGLADYRSMYTWKSWLAGWLVRDNALPTGTVLLTGTGIVPADDFTLEDVDEVEIHSSSLGRLVNRCAAAAVVPASAT